MKEYVYFVERTTDASSNERHTVWRVCPLQAREHVTTCINYDKAMEIAKAMQAQTDKERKP